MPTHREVIEDLIRQRDEARYVAQECFWELNYQADEYIEKYPWLMPESAPNLPETEQGLDS